MRSSFIHGVLARTGESNPGHVSNSGYTALHRACITGMARVAIALIETGESNPGLVNPNHGKTALLYAMDQVILQTNMRTRRNDMISVALALIRTGESNPGHVSNNGSTALIAACMSRTSNIVLALLSTSESNPDHVDSDGKTALDRAKRQLEIVAGDEELVRELTVIINALERLKIEKHYETMTYLSRLPLNRDVNGVISKFVNGDLTRRRRPPKAGGRRSRTTRLNRTRRNKSQPRNPV